MKEKIKKIFKNKKLWECILEIFCGALLLFIGYGSGFAQGVLLDNEIRTEIIENGIDTLKKDKIKVKRVVESDERYSPLSTIGETTKVELFINEDIVTDFYYDVYDVQFEYNYNVYSNDDETIYLNITFLDEQSESDAYFFDLQINDLYLYFTYNRNQVTDLHYSENLNSVLDDTVSYDEILNNVGAFILDNKDLIGLNNYYYNSTVNDYSYIDNEGFTGTYVYTYDIQQPTNFLIDFIRSAGQVVIDMSTILVGAVGALGLIFYSNGQLTIVGSAMALALGVGAIYLLFRMIRGLIKKNNRG